VWFSFTTRPQAALAAAILNNYNHVCYLGYDSSRVNIPSEDMVLEPSRATSPAPPGTKETCTTYASSQVGYEENPPGLQFDYVGLRTTSPVLQPIQQFNDTASMMQGYAVAKDHTHQCWIGPDTSSEGFKDLSKDNFEYWW
jgi:hypothetical protein